MVKIDIITDMESGKTKINLIQMGLATFVNEYVLWILAFCIILLFFYLKIKINFFK